MALKRTKLIVGVSTVGANQPIITETDVSKIEFIGVFFKSDVANWIILQERIGADEWYNYEYIELRAGGYGFLNIWSAPFWYIRFISTNPATVRWQLTLKT